MDISVLLIVLILVGCAAGVIAGLLGVGGGIVIVPALYFVFSSLDYPEETRMHVAIATSLATIIFTSLRSLQSHNKHGVVDWELLKGWAPYIVVGAAIGTLLADHLNTVALLGAFGLLAFLVALKMAFGGAKWVISDRLPGGLPRMGWAGTTGFLSALMGIGGGTFGVVIQTLYGQSITRAVATSAGLGAVIALPSTAGNILTGLDIPAAMKPPLTLGYVNIPAFAIIVPLTVLCAPIGVRLAHSINTALLKKLFALFLAIAALNMIRKAMGG